MTALVRRHRYELMLDAEHHFGTVLNGRHLEQLRRGGADAALINLAERFVQAGAQRRERALAVSAREARRE